MESSEFSFCILMFDSRILSLNIFDVDSDLEFFRWMKLDPNGSSYAEMEDEQRDELEVSELELLSLFPIEEMDAMKETLGSLWN